MRAPQTLGKAPGPNPNLYRILKQRASELRAQMEDVQDRRDQLSRSLDGTTGQDRAGIEGRIKVLDDRLLQIEADLNLVERDQVATAPAAPVPPPIPPNWRYSED